MPRDALITRFSHPWAISIHLMSGEWFIQLALFLVGTVALSFFDRRLSHPAKHVCGVGARRQHGGSSHPVILHGGDDVIRLLLFWSMFAPLNGRWSLDSLLNPSRPPLHVANASWGTQALMLSSFHLLVHRGVEVAPDLDQGGVSDLLRAQPRPVRQAAGQVLIQYPDVMRAMTHGTVALELLGPFFLFIPIWTARVRLLVVLTFIAFHAGIGHRRRSEPFPGFAQRPG